TGGGPAAGPRSTCDILPQKKWLEFETGLLEDPTNWGHDRRADEARTILRVRHPYNAGGRRLGAARATVGYEGVVANQHEGDAGGVGRDFAVVAEGGCGARDDSGGGDSQCDGGRAGRARAGRAG